MTLCNVKPWILQAQREKFAVGAFNANTMEQVQAIVRAAQDENAPVILQVSHHALQYVGNGNEILGLRYMAEIGKIAAQSVDVPVALHIDHAGETEVLQAMAMGFTSVMFDGGALPYEENVRVTKRLTEIAHSLGICIEAELGEVPRAGRSGLAEPSSDLTDPDVAADFARRTGIDILAVAIGSVHAVKQKVVTLDLNRLRQIRSVVEVPLVLHGSSGVTDAHIAEGIRAGLCKVNIATQLSQTFSQAVRATLTADSSETDPRRYLGPGRDAMQEHVRERMRFVGAAGKAQLAMVSAS